MRSRFKLFSPKTPLVIAFLSGIVMGLTLAPVGLFPLAWTALVPLWVLVANASTQKAIRYGLAWGFGYHGFALFWVTGIHPMTWLGVPWAFSLAIALFCWLFVTLWGAVLVAVWAAAISKSRVFDAIAQLKKSQKTTHFQLSISLFRILWGVALWCALEALWSASPLWWTSLSLTQSPHNLAILQFAQLSGYTTAIAAIVAVNGLVAEGLIASIAMRVRVTRLLWSLTLILWAGLHGMGLVLYNRPLVNEKPLQVGIIQGNIPNDIKLFATGLQKSIQNYTEGYERLVQQKVDVVLTPEGAIPLMLASLPETALYQALLQHKTPIWLGTYRKKAVEGKKSSYTNSLVTLTGKGQAFSQFDKVKLVPLGEYIPFEPILGKIIDRLSPLEAHQIAGDPHQVFDTPFGRAIVGICYESTFAEHFRDQAARGGEFMITASNNAHYNAAMPAQHHAQDVLRAIETDRWAARATNTGYSGIVDPRGRTLWQSEIDTYEIHAATIYRRETQTLYVRWGNWLMWSLLGLSAIAGLGLFLLKP
ncbi:apolipoprotein N-acyltransferase [Lusitaniella coriacea LEGE 07157]|uniref:Apolipoprotein N-acyltransferase n=1 Tax=Lusitaniella coriacea LEGE 07157 TaxID=945747 RepID=A0A8J7DVX1_9CYAN|nr:apolipoprotein N-acyltransferase [Lusitaniella coriacea]MBE9116109.1 apolipoprotein N-acyltransferase [Lusitaniella coriacea LEGE 07157]